jgi:leucyl/phenylalanyl-tRNA--protein transferase
MNNDSPYVDEDSAITFPNPALADGDVVAVGGNLSPGMLLSAYRQGIFPWFSDDNEPIVWWSLDPRFVIFPARLHVPQSLRKRIRKNPFHLSLDTCFDQVIRGCSQAVRPDQDGTWITEGMIDAYSGLHLLGYAHSVEAWLDGKLAGGLYGVSLGRCFFGESMFSLEIDASKVAFTALVGVLSDAGFGLIDCQQHTRYLSSFGALDMPRPKFLERLSIELQKPVIRGNWGSLIPEFPNSVLWNELRGRVAGK